MNAILIARVSTEEQKEAGNSLPAQLNRLERYCDNKNFTIVQVFSFDESAYKEERSDFDNILEFITAQKDKVAVCCDKVDRLSRNLFDKRISILYEKALNDKIELHFVSDGQTINSKISAAEKFHFGISLGLAKYYSDAISDNVKRAQEQKLRKGEWLAKAPFGYKHIKLEDGRKDIIIDDYNATIVQKIFELYATGSTSMPLLVGKVKQDYNLDWGTSHFDKMLNNHFYYGIMVIKGKQYPHRYPPIITKALFEAVQAVRKSFNIQKRKYAGKPYIYRGLINCAVCGLRITPEKHKGLVYYHCTQYKGKHGAAWFREEVLTEQFGAVFKRLQVPKDIAEEFRIALAEAHEQKTAFRNKQFNLLSREEKETKQMLDDLYFDKLKRRITESEYDKFYKTLNNKLDDVTARLTQLEEADANYYITSRHLLTLANKAYDIFLGSEVEEKRQLIKLILSNLQLTDEKLVYDVHKPFDLILNCTDLLEWRPQRESNSCFRRERAMS